MTTRKTNNTSRSDPTARKQEIRACCGFLCSSCAAYKNNAKTGEDRAKVSAVWLKLYGLDIPPAVICCDGCLEPDEKNPHRIGKDCPIRTCVLEKKIAHCGECSTFPCGLMEKHVASVESALPKARETLTPEEFRLFVDPYLCRGFLKGGLHE